MKRILVIEDESAFREAVAFALEGAGYTVLQAENGAEGIEQARIQIPDLIVSDVVLDSVDGFEAVVTLRRDPRTAGIPIILMTGKADKEGLVHAIELGADDYLTKPFTIPELLEAISIRFRKQEEQRRLQEGSLTNPKSHLTIGIPGDLRTPLAGILGFSKAISREYVDMSKSEVIELGRAIQKAARQMLRLSENFSILAQIDVCSGDQSKIDGLRSLRTSDLREAIEPSISDVANHYERAEDLVAVITEGQAACAPEYLSKMAFELADNAFKFSSRGQKVQVSAGISDGTSSLIVTDFGKGITSEVLNAVNAFSTLSSRYRDDHPFGWGLAVVKRLAEIHGGSLSLKSAGAAGTMAKVTLPIGNPS